MPRYDFQCAQCGAIEEHTFRMADKPDHLACGCGGQASSIISDQIETIVKGNERPYKLDGLCLPVGWENGNTDADAQERAYAKIIASERKQALEVDKKAIKGGIRKIATQPREHHRLRTRQYGRDYYSGDAADIKAKLKSDGLLFKD